MLNTTVEVRTKNTTLYNNAHNEFVLERTDSKEVLTAPRLTIGNNSYTVSEFVEMIRRTFKTLLSAVASQY